MVIPLPPSNGMSYILNIIDRFTRWTVATAIILPDAKATTCAQALIRRWISRCSLPKDITSD